MTIINTCISLVRAFQSQALHYKTIKAELKQALELLVFASAPLSGAEHAAVQRILGLQSQVSKLSFAQANKINDLFLAIQTQHYVASMPVEAQAGHMQLWFAGEPQAIAIPQATIELFRCHSEYFRSNFSAFKEKQAPMTLEVVTINAFQQIANYLTTRIPFELNQENISEMYVVADFLQMPLIIDLCRNQLQAMVKSASMPELIAVLIKACVGEAEAIPGWYKLVFAELVDRECLRIFNSGIFNAQIFNELLIETQTLHIFWEVAANNFPEAARYFRCITGTATDQDSQNWPEKPTQLDGLCYRLLFGNMLPESYFPYFNEIGLNEPNAQWALYLTGMAPPQERIQEVFTSDDDAKLLTNYYYHPEKLAAEDYALPSLQRYPKIAIAILQKWQTNQNSPKIIDLVGRLLCNETAPEVRLQCEGMRIQAQLLTGAPCGRLSDFPLQGSYLTEHNVRVYFDALFQTHDYDHILRGLRALESKGLDAILQPFRVRFSAENLEIWSDDILANETTCSPHGEVLWQLNYWGIRRKGIRYYDSAIAAMSASLPANNPFKYSCMGYLSQQDGDHEMAIKNYTRALQLGAPSGIRHHRALCYLTVGRRNEALQDAQRVESLSRCPVPGFILDTQLGLDIFRVEEQLWDFSGELQTKWRAKWAFISGETDQAMAMVKDSSLLSDLALFYEFIMGTGKMVTFRSLPSSSPARREALQESYAWKPLFDLSKDAIRQKALEAKEAGSQRFHQYLNTALEVFDSEKEPESFNLPGWLGLFQLLNFWMPLPLQPDRMEEKQQALQALVLPRDLHPLIPYFLAAAEHRYDDVIVLFERGCEEKGSNASFRRKNADGEIRDKVVAVATAEERSSADEFLQPNEALLTFFSQPQSTPEIRATPYSLFAACAYREKFKLAEVQAIRRQLGPHPWGLLLDAFVILGKNPETEKALLPLFIKELCMLKSAQPLSNSSVNRLPALICRHLKYVCAQQEIEHEINILNTLAHRVTGYDKVVVKISLAVRYILTGRWQSAKLLLEEQLRVEGFVINQGEVKQLYGLCLHQFEEYEQALENFGDWRLSFYMGAFSLALNSEIIDRRYESMYFARPNDIDLEFLHRATRNGRALTQARVNFYFDTSDYQNPAHDPYTVGCWLFREQRYQEALEYLARASDRDCRATFRLAQCNILLNKSGPAKKWYRKFIATANRIEFAGPAFCQAAEQWAHENNLIGKRKACPPKKASKRPKKT